MAVTNQQRALLVQGCEQLGLALDTAQKDKLNAYLDGLVKWNQAYNLTAIRDPGEMVVRHLLDSLAIHQAVQRDNILDVGTGPGMPGIPMAICRPHQRWTLLDSNGKKTRFLLQMKRELQLDNVTVIKARVEAMADHERFDAITCRAFTSLQDFVAHCLHLLQPNGYLLALKGQLPQAEMDALDCSRVHVDSLKITVPFLHEERHLINIRKNHTGSQAS